jgi:hypothetical protein
MRAAIALNHADLFVTEGDLANLCQRAKVNEFCPTLVLSVRNPEEVLEAVRAITGNQDGLTRNSASPPGLG